ncbi:MAG: hypothetical protein J6Y40_02835 [Bacteroidales bacterium]|nr:hypothetical protein [Bacteroidales bacterium]
MSNKRLVYGSKGGRITVWILGILLLVFGVALLLCYFFWNNGDMGMDESLLGCFAVVLGILDIVLLIRSKKLMEAIEEAEEEEEVEKDLEEGDASEFEELAGEPYERIVINPTRINEPDGSVLIYRDKGVLVYDKVKIPLDNVKDVSFSNVAMAYLPTSYDILLTMNDGFVLHIPAGMDMMQVQENMMKLQKALFAE